MKTIYSSIIILTLVFAAGCNPNHPTPGTPSSYKVKTIILDPNTGGTDTALITYDAQGRILSCYPKLYRADYDVYYTYTGNSMTIQHSYSWSGNIFDCKLNASGYLDSIGLYDFNYSRVTSARFTYNSDGFLIRQIEPDSSSELYIRGYDISYVWSDSCLTSMTDSLYGRASNTATYTYYTTREYRDRGLEDIANSYSYMMPDIALRGVLVLGNALGGHSKYLRKTKTINGGNTINYSYDFDVYGRVITQRETEAGNTKTYHYTYY
ncbi:MAG: hypothetical protein JSS76_03635 [Bacteroidetes bacterium]|nr:hypothetical protein [Bacteroidota bacterium]